MALIERKRKMEFEQIHKEREDRLLREDRLFFQIGDSKDTAIVDFQDREEFYFQVLNTIRYGESDYIRKNEEGEFEVKIKLRL